MKNVELNELNLTELNISESADINGGHWYCEVAAAVGDFCEGVAEGFKAGVEAWGKFYV